MQFSRVVTISRSNKRLNDSQPLLNLEFAVIASKRSQRKNIGQRIKCLGGKVSTKVRGNLTAVISNCKNVQKDSVLLREAKKYNVHVVSEQFLLDVIKTDNAIQDVIIKRSLCKWGSDVSSSDVNFSFTRAC